MRRFTANWRMFTSQVEAKAAVLSKDLRLLRMYNRLEAEYARYRDFVGTAKNEEEELAVILNEIENISRKSSCHIANVKPRATKKIGNHKEISLAVTVEGTVEKLSKFLYAVEVSSALLKVRHFAITPKSGRKGTLKATLHISKILLN